MFKVVRFSYNMEIQEDKSVYVGLKEIPEYLSPTNRGVSGGLSNIVKNPIAFSRVSVLIFTLVTVLRMSQFKYTHCF